MPPVPIAPSSSLAATAVQAAGGGILLALDADRARPGVADAFVLRRGRILRVTLDAGIGLVVVQPARAPRTAISAC